MASFDSILNTSVPWIVAIIGVYLLYRPLKEPLDPLFRAIGRFISAIKNKISGEESDPLEIVSLDYE